MKSSLVLCCLVFSAGCSRSPREVAASTAAAPPVQSSPGRVAFPPGSPLLQQVRTAIVGSAEVAADQIVAPGKIQINPNRLSRVALPLPGRIVSVEVRLGDSVRQGQPLLRLESPEIEAATSDCFRAEAARTQSLAGLNKARADLDRAKDLHEHGAAPRKDVLNAEAELARAETAVKEAAAAMEQSHRRLSIYGIKPCEFGQYMVVRAPIAGKILDLAAVTGEYRNDTNAPLMTIADLSTVWVASGVPESSIRLIQRGERVNIELAAFPGETFHGRVMRVADTVDPATRSVEVQTELENPAGRFRPEMFAKIRHSHRTRILPVVPASALVQSGGRAWVFLATSPHEFQRVQVETGENIASGVPILAGLRPGDRVVTDGAMLLHGQMGGPH